MKITKFLTSRSTVIALFSALSLALLWASLVPQRIAVGKTPDWVAGLPAGVRSLATLLGLDNVVGTPWFAVLGLLFWLSLLVSAVSQYGTARALAARIPSAEVPPESVRVELAPERLDELVRQAGYRPAGRADGVARYVRNRAGYWGNFLLHVGLVVAVVFSLVYVVTQHRVLLRLTSDEAVRPTPDTVPETVGVLPLTRELPYSVLLKEVRPGFWGNDRLESLSSELYFTGRAGGDPRRVEVALSDKSRFGPYLVYQVNSYGRAFDLELSSPEGVLRPRLFLPYPDRRDRAGYGEAALPGGYLLKAKFYADAEQRSMRLNRPPFTVRLYRGSELLRQLTLEPGEAAQLGPYTVRLVRSAWWTDILLDGSRGTFGIFAGFAVILAGVLCSYCLVPREIIVREKDGALHLQQVVRRFASFYREEFEELLSAAGKTGES